MPLYCLSRTKIGLPLEEEGTQNGTKPKVLVGMPMTLYETHLHAYYHGGTLVKDGHL